MNKHLFWTKRKTGKRLLPKNVRTEYSSCESSFCKADNSSVVYYFNSDDDDEEEEINKDRIVKSKPNNSKYSYIEKEILIGDSITNIALRYGCTVEEIKRINKIFKEQEIHALDKIKIPVKAFSVLTEICEKDEEIIDSGHSSPLRERDTRVLSIGSNLLANDGSKDTFLQQMDKDLERIRHSAKSFESDSMNSTSLDEITEQLTCKRFHPLSQQMEMNRERFNFSLIIAGALIVFLILIPLLVLILFFKSKG